MNKTEEELIWEAYRFKLVREFGDIEDIIYYYNDGASIGDIAEEYDMDIDVVKSIIQNYKKSEKSIDDSDIIDTFKINTKKHHDRAMGIDASQRSDTTDREESGYDWEGTSAGFVNRSPEGSKNIRPYELGKKSRRETTDQWGKKYKKK